MVRFLVAPGECYLKLRWSKTSVTKYKLKNYNTSSIIYNFTEWITVYSCICVCMFIYICVCKYEERCSKTRWTTFKKSINPIKLKIKYQIKISHHIGIL